MGRDVVIERFVGEMSRNRFSVGMVDARSAGGAWFENDFVFEFPFAAGGGLRIPEPGVSLTIHDNNITAIGSPDPNDYRD